MPNKVRQVTMVLHNFAREEQLHQILDGLSTQHERPFIGVWNNNVDTVFKDDRADWIVNSNRNTHCRTVISMWQMAATPWVARMDDDLYMADDDVLGDALVRAKQMTQSTQILGAYGVRLWAGENYQSSHHMAMPRGHGQVDETGKPDCKIRDYSVDIVKGRFMLLRQSATHQLSPSFSHVHTDLHISNSLAGRNRFHHVLSGVFWARTDLEDPEKCEPRLVDFPEDAHGYCTWTDHMAARNVITQAWAAQCLPNRKVKSKPKDLKRDRNTGATTAAEEQAET